MEAISGQYHNFDDQHDRMTTLVNVSDDAVKRAKKVNDTVQKIAANISLLSDEAAKLKGYAGEGIRNITDDGVFIPFFLQYTVVSQNSSFFLCLNFKGYFRSII